MRIVFLGASELSVITTSELIERGHEIVLVEADKEKIDLLSEELDCSFLHGDGSNPKILQEAGPKQTDFLFCLTDNDQDNIIASLVGRSLGFKRVITSIRNREFQSICLELGLEDTIIPSRTISRYLADMVKGVDILELSTVLKNQARFFAFLADEDSAGPLSELELPDKTRIVCVYREDQFILPEPETRLRKEDEVVLITHSENLPDLQERFPPSRRS